MPTYDYHCDACGHKLELFQSITEPAKRKCPKCGRLKLRRLFGTGGAIMFKGSGFYKTDYRSDSYKKDAAADKQKQDKGSEAKPAGGGESKTSSGGDGATKKDTSKKKSSSGDGE